MDPPFWCASECADSTGASPRRDWPCIPLELEALRWAPVVPLLLKNHHCGCLRLSRVSARSPIDRQLHQARLSTPVSTLAQAPPRRRGPAFTAESFRTLISFCALLGLTGHSIPSCLAPAATPSLSCPPIVACSCPASLRFRFQLTAEAQPFQVPTCHNPTTHLLRYPTVPLSRTSSRQPGPSVTLLRALVLRLAVNCPLSFTAASCRRRCRYRCRYRCGCVTALG